MKEKIKEIIEKSFEEKTGTNEAIDDAAFYISKMFNCSICMPQKQYTKNNNFVIEQRYTIESWVCDYGIFDNNHNTFIGNPIPKYSDAEII